MSFLTYKSWISIYEEEFPKNKWQKADIEKFDNNLISLVQTAYKKAPKGSFINSKRDLGESDWLSIDFDEYPDLDATIFYRKPRSNEKWRGIKIQGIGHDGSFDAIGIVLNKLRNLLNQNGIWVEASDAIEHILYKISVPYVTDEKIAEQLFPNTNLKFKGDKGKYTRIIPDKEENVTETIFGKPVLLK